MKYISAIFLLFLVAFCPQVHSQNLPGVILAIKIAEYRAGEVVSKLNDMFRGLHDRPTIDILEPCLENYREARTNLGWAIRALQDNENSKAPGFVNTALNQGRSCHAPALAQPVAEFVQSCSEALDIVKNTKL